MERQFVLPATFAAAFHAALLFGFRPSAVSAVSDATRATSHEQPKPRVEVFLDPPKPEALPDEAVAPQGDSDTPRPSAPELPPVNANDRIAIDIPPAIHTISTGEKFDLKPPGRPDGVGTIVDVRSALAGVGQLDNPPRARLQARPFYPAEARRSQLGGEVVVEFIVDETGAVVSPRVVRSSDRIFEEATLRAVAQWRFEPGRRAGQIVRFRMAVPVVFNLTGD